MAPATVRCDVPEDGGRGTAAFPLAPIHRMEAMMSVPSLDPAAAAYAWARYRRVMRWMLAVIVMLIGVALRLVWRHGAYPSIRLYVLVALGVATAMLIGSGFVGLAMLGRTRAGNPSDRRKAAGGNPPPARRQSDAPE
jgi:uncharacterized membrane protein